MKFLAMLDFVPETNHLDFGSVPVLHGGYGWVFVILTLHDYRLMLTFKSFSFIFLWVEIILNDEFDNFGTYYIKINSLLLSLNFLQTSSLSKSVIGIDELPGMYSGLFFRFHLEKHLWLIIVRKLALLERRFALACIYWRWKYQCPIVMMCWYDRDRFCSHYCSGCCHLVNALFLVGRNVLRFSRYSYTIWHLNFKP